MLKVKCITNKHYFMVSKGRTVSFTYYYLYYILTFIILSQGSRRSRQSRQLPVSVQALSESRNFIYRELVKRVNRKFWSNPNANANIRDIPSSLLCICPLERET